MAADGLQMLASGACIAPDGAVDYAGRIKEAILCRLCQCWQAGEVVLALR